MLKKILVVDDEKHMRELLENFFICHDYEVYTAESGEKAFDIIQKVSFKVMLFDLNMPGMNGIELCEKIREFNQLAFIFAVTGARSLFEIAACRESGFDDYFTKPIVLKELLVSVEHAFERINKWKTY